ncbi:MAG: hypothetical protein WCI20_12890 [bacterium]
MNKWMAMLGCVSIGLVLTGCAGLMTAPPSGVAPGGLFSDVNYPSYRESQTRFTFTHDDLVILGPVTATSESQCILGLVAQGDNGFGNLMRAAKAKYPECDGVINIQWDTRWNLICMGLLSKVTATVEGTAIKIKR